jgi:hypothetical protein
MFSKATGIEAEMNDMFARSEREQEERAFMEGMEAEDRAISMTSLFWQKAPLYAVAAAICGIEDDEYEAFRERCLSEKYGD